jgi:hypothetical protein
MVGSQRHLRRAFGTRWVRLTILGAAVVATVSGSVTAASASVRTPSSTTVTVQGNDASLTNTGVVVPAGKNVKITASGLIAYNTGGAKTTPNGHQVASEICATGVSAGWFNANLECLSLVGKFGNGKLFQVGSSVSINDVEGGRLYLIYNDNDYLDNSGHFTVTITVS